MREIFPLSILPFCLFNFYFLLLSSFPRIADVTIAIAASPAITVQELWNDSTKICGASPIPCKAELLNL
jgi:hypothetical protein